MKLQYVKLLFNESDKNLNIVNFVELEEKLEHKT
jgi:hypothetical protein